MRRRRRSSRAASGISPWPFAGMALLAASLFLYLYSAVLVPWYVFGLLMLAWLVMFVLATQWWTPYPRRVPVVAVTAIVLWFATLVGGAYLVGW